MKKILLIEPSADQRDLCRDQLRQAGFEVDTAAGAEDGLDRLEAFAPDVVVCDRVMPGTSGLQVMEQILSRAPSTLVLVCDEHAEPGHAVEAMRQGATGYLAKSDGPEGLTREIAAAVAFRGHAEEAHWREAQARQYRQQLERKVAEKTAELSALQKEHARAEKLAALGTLLAGVVHEIGAPVGVINANLDFLERKQDDPAERAEILADLRQASQRIERLIQTLRRLSRVGDSHGWSELGTALREAKRLCSTRVPAGVALEWEVDATVRQVYLTHDDLVSVVTNLVTNAAHALDGREEGGEIVVSLERTGPRAVLAVRDNGEGIRPEHLSRVLDPFFTTKPAGKGTGLGLSLVDQIIRSAGGSVAIESEPGQGTTLSVMLRVI